MSDSRSPTATELDSILPEVFALVREGAKRTLGQRHFDVQLIGGLVLHQGKIAEMKTGEGKTLVATLPSVLNALTGRGVHVVTVNDYLARFPRRVDGEDLQLPGAVGRLHRGRHQRGRTPRGVRRGRHATGRTTSSASTTCATT